jgi:hypothetical protein
LVAENNEAGKIKGWHASRTNASLRVSPREHGI